MLNISRFKETIFQVKKSIPIWFFYYLIFYLLALFLLVFYVPGNDYDTMSSYIARIKLEEFGSLKETGTLEIQYIFPRFFDYLHKPFLELGYFTTLPNFLLFLIFIFVLFYYHSSYLYFFFIILIFSSSAILITITALKNDVSLALLLFLGWFIICHYKNKSWYLTLCMLIIAAMVGTKWHGIITGGLLIIPMLYRIYIDKLINRSAIAILVLFLPVLYWFSSADIYFDNYISYGSFTPKINYLFQSNNPSLLINIYRFFFYNLFSNFGLLICAIDTFFHLGIWDFLIQFSGGMDYFLHTREQMLAPSSVTILFGFPILLMLIVNGYILTRSDFSFYVKGSSAIALAYFFILCSTLELSSWSMRYFLATYIMSIVPVSEFLAKLSLKKWMRQSMIIYTVLMSLYCLTFNNEKVLVNFLWKEGEKSILQVRSIWNYINDRDALYFMNWAGYLQAFDFYRHTVKTSDSLIFFNNSQGADCPFIYPFIKDRERANTRIINTRYGQNYKDELGKFDYIMVYRDKGEIAKDPRYEKVYTYPSQNNDELNLYKLKVNQTK